MVVWRSVLLSALSSFILSSVLPNGARAQDTAADPLEQAARIAGEACRISSRSGAGATVDGQASANVDGFIARRLLGVEGGIEGTANATIWSGIQQVLREHQVIDNQGVRDCSIALLPELLRFKLEWLKATEPAPTGATPDPSDAGCYPAARLRNEAVLIEKGMCFHDETGIKTAQITRAIRDIVEYNNAKGKTIRCLPNMDCSFGFSDRTVFSMRVRDNDVYLVGRPI